jgi:hypothetical protein
MPRRERGGPERRGEEGEARPRQRRWRALGRTARERRPQRAAQQRAEQTESDQAARHLQEEPGQEQRLGGEHRGEVTALRQALELLLDDQRGGRNPEEWRAAHRLMVPDAPARTTVPRVADRSGEGPDGADETEGIARLGERGDLHHVAGVRRLDELAVPDVHPLVLRTARARLEEDEVARLQ